MPGKILIVEDENLIALHLKTQLEQAGVVVFGVAENADDALTLAARHLPDLVLMDIHIRGGRDGISCATELRVSHGIPAMFITAYADRETLERAKISQPPGYISKPFLGANLAPQIEMALQ
jgi:CheY-like chemotaxis protein